MSPIVMLGLQTWPWWFGTNVDTQNV